MKNLIPLICLLSVFACKSKEVPVEEDFEYEEKQTPAQLGEKLFNGKGNCYACHRPDQKFVGPSLVEIATIYKQQKGDMVKFLKEDAKAIVDPANYAAMKVNFSITKRMSDVELKALEAYILEHK